MTKITIIGAGMAGLLAAGMLRDEAECILEAQPNLPNNHTALLRFRSSVVGDALNIPFKKVRVMKAVDAGGMNPVAAMLSYSMKSNGTATMRSSISAHGEIEERYIAPPNLVEQMANKVSCPICFNTKWDGLSPGIEPIISTLPMPVLMDILGFEIAENASAPLFQSVSGYNITAELTNTDAYVTLYIPDRARMENRISITGSKLTIEVALPRLSSVDVDRIVNGKTITATFENIKWAVGRLGLLTSEYPSVLINSIKISRQQYAKILPIDEGLRQRFIMWASDKHGVYSLGRFATWRPGLLLDDVVGDVRVIRNLINGHSAYSYRKR